MAINHNFQSKIPPIQEEIGVIEEIEINKYNKKIKKNNNKWNNKKKNLNKEGEGEEEIGCQIISVMIKSSLNLLILKYKFQNLKPTKVNLKKKNKNKKN